MENVRNVFFSLFRTPIYTKDGSKKWPFFTSKLACWHAFLHRLICLRTWPRNRTFERATHTHTYTHKYTYIFRAEASVCVIFYPRPPSSPPPPLPTLSFPSCFAPLQKCLRWAGGGEGGPNSFLPSCRVRVCPCVSVCPHWDMYTRTSEHVMMRCMKDRTSMRCRRLFYRFNNATRFYIIRSIISPWKAISSVYTVYIFYRTSCMTHMNLVSWDAVKYPI